MATLTVRDIDDADYEKLCALAKANNRSMAAQVRAMIAEAARGNASDREDAVMRMKELRDRAGWTLPAGKTSFDLLREERDSW